MGRISELFKTSREEDLQQYLKANEKILLYLTRSIYAYSILIPKFRFGSDFVSDFVAISGQSSSYWVSLIELEPAQCKVFNKDGTFSRRTNQALKQIDEWEAWIRDNEQYFRDSLANHIEDIGFKDDIKNGITRNRRFIVQSYVIIGRRDELSEKDNKRRALIRDNFNGNREIVPFDRLADVENEIKNNQGRNPLFYGD